MYVSELNKLYFQVIRRQACTPKADVWSIGVIAYILLAGYPPFYIHETSSQAEQGSNEEALLRKIVNADYQFHPDTWQDISPEAISFIR
jgi:serine/threonine protein kinase